MKKILKEITKTIIVFILPTILLIIGLLGKDGIQLMSKFEIRNAQSYIITAIILYVLITIIIIYSYYTEYKKNIPKKKKISSHLNKLDIRCKNIISTLIIASLIKLFLDIENIFINILLLCLIIFLFFCLYKRKKTNSF